MQKFLMVLAIMPCANSLLVGMRKNGRKKRKKRALHLPLAV